ncbi:MAG: 1,4-dihydroxy-2-naphthoate octaprenyltransferase [Candidatus Eisenbacteria bacterium]|nr:1,4-dihydroxy-2-naphthoate octaprenyltransferase [Candidatus Eisenbacteria bacterium]
MTPVSTDNADQSAAAVPAGWGPGARSPGVWWRAARPFTLPASVVPIVVGGALAWREGVFHPLRFVLALVASLLVQAAVNFVDEYSDHDRPAGALKHIAPYKVIARGELTSKGVRGGTIVSLAVASAIGIYLIAVTHWILLAVCLASVAAVYFYAGGPRPLGHAGVGVPLVFVFMGIVMVAGAEFIHTERWSAAVLWIALPVACLVSAILVANDLRDMEEDRAEGKRTAVTAWGRPAGWWLWTLLVAAAYLVILAWALVHEYLWTPVLVAPSLPLAVRAGHSLWRSEDRETLAQGLRRTALLHLAFGILLSIGLVLGG